MISSIQSHQNTPKLQPNNFKIKNSPSFGTSFSHQITPRAKDVIKELQKGENWKNNGILSAILDFISKSKEALNNDGIEATSKLKITDILVDSAPNFTIRGDLEVCYNGKTDKFKETDFCFNQANPNMSEKSNIFGNTKPYCLSSHDLRERNKELRIRIEDGIAADALLVDIL